MGKSFIEFLLMSKFFLSLLVAHKQKGEDEKTKLRRKLNISESKVGDEAIGLEIKNQISELIDGPDGGTLDLGVVGEVSDTTIDNIKKTYRNAIIKVVDDHYVLSFK